MQISKISRLFGFSVYLVLSCAAQGQNKEKGEQPQPEPAADPIELTLPQYQAIGSHYVEDPYPMDIVFTVPARASDIVLADSLIMNRQPYDGHYTVLPLDQFHPVLTSIDQATRVTLRGSIEVGTYAVLVKTKDQVFGIDLVKVKAQRPIPQSGWDDEEYSTCDDVRRDCNIMFKKQFLGTLKARNTDRLVAQERFGGKDYRGVFIFNAKESAEDPYLKGTFSLNFDSVSGGNIPDRFPVGLSGECEQRNGHLACRDSQQPDQYFYLSYRGERINTFALSYQRVNYTFR